MTDATPTDEPKMPELLPCPFCGTKIKEKDVSGFGSRQHERIKKGWGFDYSAVWIHCPKCGAALGIDDADIKKSVYETIIEKWNTRTPPPAAPGRERA